MKLGMRNFVWLVSAGVLLLGIGALVVSRTVFWSKAAGGWAGLAFLESPMAPSWRPRPRRAERARSEEGGVVLWVLWDSPAAKAGIRRGDQLVEIGGIPASDAKRLHELAARSRAGDTVTYRVGRGLQDLTFRVRLVGLFEFTQVIINILSTAVAGFAFALIAFLVWSKRPKDRVAGVFYVFAVVVAASFLSGGLAFTDFLNAQGLAPFNLIAESVKYPLNLLATSLILVLLLHLSLIFPTDRPIVRRHPQVFRWIYELTLLPYFIFALVFLLDFMPLGADHVLRSALVLVPIDVALIALRPSWSAAGSSRRYLFLHPETTLLASSLALLEVELVLRLLRLCWPGSTLITTPFLKVSLGLPWFVSLVFAFVFCPLTTCAALFRSYRESGVEKRTQVRWPVWGIIAALVGGLLIPLVLSMAQHFMRREIVSQPLVVPLASACCLLIPLSFAFSILKYRLMSIEVILRKTAVYSVLSAVIVSLYLILVAGLGDLLVRSLHVSSRSVTIASTLTLAAFFFPLRNGVQDLVEHRFFRKRQDYSKTLSLISSQISAAVNLHNLLAMVAEQLMRAMPNRGLAVFTRSSMDGVYWATIKVGLKDEILGHLNFGSESPILPMLAKPFDPRQANLPEPETKKLRSIGSALLVPVKQRAELIAFLSLGRKLPDEAYDDDDLNFLAELSDQIARGIRELELRLQEEEVDESRQIQLGLLPKTIPQLAGYGIAGESHPARVVGGDYFDVLRVGEDKLGLCIADASGKGMPAALMMSNLQAAVRAFASENLAPPDLCAKLNHVIWSNFSRDKFITLFYALLDGPSGRLAYVNAGHNAPLVLRRNSRALRLETGGTILGAFGDSTYQQGNLVLEPGDLLVAFTDGVSECMNALDEEWGEHRLLEALQSSDGLGPGEIIKQVTREAQTFAGGSPQFDDMTLLVLQRQVVPIRELERNQAIRQIG
jgi:serine phosphatase RsbU (regulator of sigma subunit)/heme/copper-type cytochrome/quinol oxidase subunit 4